MPNNKFLIIGSAQARVDGLTHVPEHRGDRQVFPLPWKVL